MTETHRLREMLDEQGVEWWHDADVSPDHTEWMTDCMAFTSLGVDGDMLAVKTISKMTPEQAIAATVGERTTTRNGKRVRRHYRDVPLCECCGQAIGDERYNYCPKCGARIVK